MKIMFIVWGAEENCLVDHYQIEVHKMTLKKRGKSILKTSATFDLYVPAKAAPSSREILDPPKTNIISETRIQNT